MLLSTLATLGGLASSIYSGVKSAEANNDALANSARQHADNVRVLQSRLNSDYTGRADVQAILNRTQDLLNEQYSRSLGQSIVGGATDNAVLAQKQANLDTLSRQMTNLSAQSSAFKENASNSLLAENNNFANQQQAIQRAKADAIAQAGSQAVSALSSLAGTDKNSLADDPNALKMFGIGKSGEKEQV